MSGDQGHTAAAAAAAAETDHKKRQSAQLGFAAALRQVKSFAELHTKFKAIGKDKQAGIKRDAIKKATALFKAFDFDADKNGDLNGLLAAQEETSQDFRDVVLAALKKFYGGTPRDDPRDALCQVLNRKLHSLLSGDRRTSVVSPAPLRKKRKKNGKISAKQLSAAAGGGGGGNGSHQTLIETLQGLLAVCPTESVRVDTAVAFLVNHVELDQRKTVAELTSHEDGDYVYKQMPTILGLLRDADAATCQTLVLAMQDERFPAMQMNAGYPHLIIASTKYDADTMNRDFWREVLAITRPKAIAQMREEKDSTETKQDDTDAAAATSPIDQLQQAIQEAGEERDAQVAAAFNFIEVHYAGRIREGRSTLHRKRQPLLDLFQAANLAQCEILVAALQDPRLGIRPKSTTITVSTPFQLMLHSTIWQKILAITSEKVADTAAADSGGGGGGAGEPESADTPATTQITADQIFGHYADAKLKTWQKRFQTITPKGPVDFKTCIIDYFAALAFQARSGPMDKDMQRGLARRIHFELTGCDSLAKLGKVIAIVYDHPRPVGTPELSATLGDDFAPIEACIHLKTVELIARRFELSQQHAAALAQRGDLTIAEILELITGASPTFRTALQSAIDHAHFATQFPNKSDGTPFHDLKNWQPPEPTEKERAILRMCSPELRIWLQAAPIAEQHNQHDDLAAFLNGVNTTVGHIHGTEVEITRENIEANRGRILQRVLFDLNACDSVEAFETATTAIQSLTDKQAENRENIHDILSKADIYHLLKLTKRTADYWVMQQNPKGANLKGDFNVLLNLSNQLDAFGFLSKHRDTIHIGKPRSRQNADRHMQWLIGRRLYDHIAQIQDDKIVANNATALVALLREPRFPRVFLIHIIEAIKQQEFANVGGKVKLRDTPGCGYKSALWQEVHRLKRTRPPQPRAAANN